MKHIIQKKIVQVFSDGSINFEYTIIKRSKKINYYTKDHKNFSLNQKVSNFNVSKGSVNFKNKYL